MGLSIPLAKFFQLAVTPELTVLPVTPAIADQVTRLEALRFHQDPADPLIVSTGLVHGLRPAINNTLIQQWAGVPMLW